MTHDAEWGIMTLFRAFSRPKMVDKKILLWYNFLKYAHKAHE